MNEVLRRCLDDLSARIDEQEEDRLTAAWADFLEGRCRANPFVPPTRKPKPPTVAWPDIHVGDNAVLHDRDTMMLAQFKAVSDILAGGYDSTLSVRCNYGIAIMASQLGCEVVEMPPQQFNTPTAWHLSHSRPDGDSVAAAREAVQRGMPDLRAGQGGDVFDTGEAFLDVLAQWPVLGRRVNLIHPDAQGPMDNAEVAWGSDIFMAFYDEPELVRAFLDLMSDHYIAFLKKWFALVPPTSPYSRHWGLMLKGQIVLRDDSLMNLSPEIYRDFIRDREARCLRELGGGMIHFCGRGDHFIADMAAIQADGLTAVNVSQPHLNNMDLVYPHTVDRGLAMIGFMGDWATKARAAGRDLRGRVHSYAWSMNTTPDDPAL
jgi:hypothetical protein